MSKSANNRPRNSESIRIEYDPGNGSDVPSAIVKPIERLLQKAHADGFVFLFDVDQIVWFDVTPGARCRELRAKIEAIIAKGGWRD